MNAWERNREVIERLIAHEQLQPVQPAPPAWAEQQLRVCEQHLDSARTLDAERDPEATLTLAYDAARKAAAVLLEVRGLRAKADSSHATLAEAVGEQFGGPFARLNRYRRMRHAAEYPTPQDPRTGSADARQAIADCAEIVAGARRLLDSGHPTPWRG